MLCMQPRLLEVPRMLSLNLKLRIHFLIWPSASFLRRGHLASLRLALERLTDARMLTVVVARERLRDIDGVGGLEGEAVLMLVSHCVRHVEALFGPYVGLTLWCLGTMLLGFHNTFLINISSLYLLLS